MVTTILHLITGLETGGAEQMLVRLVTRLDPQRHRSVVISMTGPGTLGAALCGTGIELYSLNMRRGWPDPRALSRLAGILRRVRPDIVQTWLYHADLLGTVGRQLAGVPCRLFWNIQCTDMAGWNVVRKLLARLSRVVDLVVANSLSGQRFHEALGYRPRCWVHIPNACDTAEFAFDAEARRALRAEWGVGDGQIAIGLPARYHPMKDHGNFLAAATRLIGRRPETIFVLAGPGADRGSAELTEAVARHGLTDRVRLLGNREDMPRVYSALDIATLSSAYGEGSPNVLVEAMSCGLPCAATDCGDVAEMLGPHGLVVPRRDPAALSSAWERLVALGAAGRATLGRNARCRAIERYDVDIIATRYDRLYDHGKAPVCG